MSDGIIAETITITGHGGDEIEAYFARPVDGDDQPSVVVLHHMPGYDRATKEIVRTFAVYGYAALMPNLHHRYAPGAKAGRRGGGGARRRRRARRAVPRRRAGRHRPAARPPRVERQGRRDRLLLGRAPGVPRRVHASTSTPPSTATAGAADVGARRPTPRAARCSGCSAPTTSSPSPDDVAAHGDGARGERQDLRLPLATRAPGHAFFSVDRPSYRLDAAKDGWKQIWAFFGTHLKGA